MAVQINVAANQAALVQSIQAGVQAYNQRFANQNQVNLQVNARAFSQPLGRITGDVKDFEAALAASNARVIAFGASTAILGGVLRGFRSIAEVTVEVEKNLADINRVFGLTTKELQKFSTDLFNVSKQTASSFGDASKAALEFSRQGVKAEEVLQRTADAMTLARLAGMNVNNAIEALTATVNGFQATGITTTQVLNKLVAVEQSYAVSAGDLAEALSRTGLAAQEAGVNIDQLNALVTAAQEKTARGGAVIGNALKTIFTRLQRTETLDQLEAFNIGVRDIQGNILPAVQILQNFAGAYNNLADSQRAQLSEQVAGVYQVNILKAIISDLNNKQGAYAGALQKGATATNEAQIAAAKLNQTLDALLSQTSTVAQQFANNVGKVTFEPLAKYTAESFKSLFENLNEILEGEGVGSTFANGLLKGIRNVLAGPGAIGAFFVLFKLIQNSFTYLSQALPQIVGITTETQNRKNIEQAILQIMQQQGPVAQALAGQMGNQTAQAQLLLQLARQQTAEYQRQQALVAALAPALSAQGVSARGQQGLRVTRSSGYLPDVEVASAKAQGATGNVKAVAGVGKIGGKSYIANNKEIQIPNFAGTGEPAVIPTYGGGIQKAIAMIGNGKSGSILNQGFIPNFALSKKEFLEKGFTGSLKNLAPLSNNYREKLQQVADYYTTSYDSNYKVNFTNDNISGSGIKYVLREIPGKTSQKINNEAENLMLFGTKQAILNNIPKNNQSLFNFEIWNKNRSDYSIGKIKFGDKVKSLDLKKKYLVNFKKQFIGLRSLIAGEIFEKRVEQIAKVKRAEISNARLDFEPSDIVNYLGGEAKVGDYDVIGLISKAIGSVGKSFKNNIEDDIPINKNIELYVPEKPTGDISNMSSGYIPNFASSQLPSEYRNPITGKLNNPKIAAAIRMGKLDPAVAMAAGYKTSSQSIQERKQGVLERVLSSGFKRIGISGIGTLPSNTTFSKTNPFAKNFESLALKKAQQMFGSNNIVFASNYEKGGRKFKGAPTNTAIDALEDNLTGPVIEMKSGDTTPDAALRKKFTQGKNELIEMWHNAMPDKKIDSIVQSIGARPEYLFYNADKEVKRGTEQILQANKGFIPNFAADYINQVMNLESNMSGNKAVLDTQSGPFPFIRNSSQPNFAAAISDHGGMNKALNDSYKNQVAAGLMNKGFVPNFAPFDITGTSLQRSGGGAVSHQKINKAINDYINSINLSTTSNKDISDALTKLLPQFNLNQQSFNEVRRAAIDYAKAQKAAAQQTQQQTQQNSASSTSRLGRLSSGLSRAGTAISIAGPTIAGFAEQAFFGNKERIDMTRGERIGKEAVGQGLSAITTGAGIGSAFGGLPGALLGGFVGGLVGLTSALNAAELSTEELNKKLEKQIQAGSENISAAQKYIEAQKALSALITSGASQKEIDTASKAVADSFKEIKNVDLAKSLLETKGGIDALNNVLAPFQKKQKATEEVSNLISTPDKQFSQSLFKFLSEKGQNSLVQSISGGFFSKTPEEYFGKGSQGARMAYIPNMLEQGKTFQQLQYAEQTRIIDSIIASVDESVDEETKTGLRQKLRNFLSESKNSKELTDQFTQLVEIGNQFSANQIEINREAVFAYAQRNKFELENIATLAQIDRELRSSQFGQKLSEKLFNFQDQLSENLISPLNRINSKFAFETQQLETKTNDEIKKINRDFGEKLVSLQQKITGPALTEFQNAVTEAEKGNIEGLKGIVNVYGPSQFPPEVLKALSDELKRREEQLKLAKENQQNEQSILNQDKTLGTIKERYAQIMNNLIIKDIELTGRKERLEMERKANLELELDRLSRRETDPAEFFGLSVLGEADKKSMLMREKSAQRIADIETSGVENARRTSLDVINIRRQQLLNQAQILETAGDTDAAMSFTNQAESLTGNNFSIDAAIQDLQSRRFATDEQEKQRRQTLEKLLEIQQQITVEKNKETKLTERNTADLQRDAQRAISFRYGLESSFDKMNKEADTIGRRLGEQIPTAFADGMTNALMEVAKGTKSIGDAFTDMAINFGQMLMQEVMRAAIGKVIGSAGLAIMGSQTGGIIGKQRGGIIRAENGTYISGNRTGDRNLALLEDGEYVLNREAVAAIGVNNLDSLNYGMAPRFQSGGGFNMQAEQKLIDDKFEYTGNLLQDRRAAQAINSGDYSAYAYSNDPYFTEMKQKAYEDFKRREMEDYQRKVKRAQMIGAIVGAVGSIALAAGMSGLATQGAKAASGLANTAKDGSLVGTNEIGTKAIESLKANKISELQFKNIVSANRDAFAMAGGPSLGQMGLGNSFFGLGNRISNSSLARTFGQFSTPSNASIYKSLMTQTVQGGSQFVQQRRQTGGLVGYQSGGFIPYGARLTDTLPRYMSGGTVMNNPNIRRYAVGGANGMFSSGTSSNNMSTYNNSQNNATNIYITSNNEGMNVNSQTSSYKPNDIKLTKEMALQISKIAKATYMDGMRTNGELSRKQTT